MSSSFQIENAEIHTEHLFASSSGGKYKSKQLKVHTRDSVVTFVVKTGDELVHYSGPSRKAAVEVFNGIV